MKKLGFTLAEVLITLGIIGVVAALTAPALVMSSRNQANGARLSTAISNLENAFTGAIAQEGASDIFGTSIWRAVPEAGLDGKSSEAAINGFVGAMKQYIRLNGYRSGDYYSEGPYPITSSGSSGNENTNLLSDYAPIDMSNGATMFVMASRAKSGSSKSNIIAGGGSLFEAAFAMVIDVNGTSAPNTVGRDLFSFFVGSDGILYPVGGRDVALFQGVGDGRWDQNGIYACLPAGNDGNNVGWGCTARLIDNGYQMDY